MATSLSPSSRTLPNVNLLAARLKLTARRAETLFWVAQGKGNGEIAIILGTSTHTVYRHVEAILECLEVESRAMAMLIALEALGWLKLPGRSPRPTGPAVTPKFFGDSLSLDVWPNRGCARCVRLGMTRGNRGFTTALRDQPPSRLVAGRS